MVSGTWKRGHKAKYDRHGTCAAPALLPGPDVADEDLDLGVIGPEPTPIRRRVTSTAGNTERADAEWEPDDEEISPDPPPGHVGKQPGQRTRQPRAGKVRVTATVRKDIEAKLGLMIAIPARVWAARDPICGGTFVQQEPEIRAALADIVCDSADLVEFFGGTGGAFMKYLQLAMALQPVGMAMYAHHVAHTVELAEGPAGDQQAYAA
jgi:hypothetical protein